MKRFIVLLLCLLIILSGCYSYNEVQKQLDEQKQASEEEYYALEEKYYEALDAYDKLCSSFMDTESNRTIVDEYFENCDSVPDDVQDAWDSIAYFLGQYY